MLSQSLSHSVSHCSCWDLTNVTLATWPVKITQPLGGRFLWCISDPIRFKTSVKFQDSMAWVRCTFANLLIKLGPHFLSQVTTKEATALPSREMNLIHFPYDYIATFLQIILFVCHTNTFNLWLIYVISSTSAARYTDILISLCFRISQDFFSTSNLFSPSQLLYLDIGLYIRISYISFCMIRHMLVRNYEGNYKNKVVKF